MFATYWVLACAISWLAYAFSAPADSDAETVSALVRDPLGLVAKFGPSIAGVVVLAIPGAGARILFWDAARRLPAVLLAAAIGVPGAITLGSLWLAASVQGVDNSSLFAAFSLFGAVYWIAVKILLGGGLGEEIGVRGVALPLLLDRMGPRLASLILGAAWALWHLPALWGQPAVIWIAQLVLTVSVSVILTFVWVRYGPSLLVAIIFHGALNGWAAFAAAEWAPKIEALDEWQVIRLLALSGLGIALLSLRWLPRNPEGETSK